MNSYNPQYYSPSQISTIADGATATQEFRGLNAGEVALNKLNIGCDDPTTLNELTATATMNEGRATLFEGVQLLALQRLFQYRSLLGGFLIEQSKAFKLAITNSSGASRVVSTDLNGYDGPLYQRRKEAVLTAGKEYPLPQFLYANATIAAGASEQRIPINIPEVSTKLFRIAISSQSDANLQIAFKVNNTVIIPLRFVSQVNDQFINKPIIQEVIINRNIPFEAQVTNLDGVTPYDISIICEAYEVQ